MKRRSSILLLALALAMVGMGATSAGAASAGMSTSFPMAGSTAETVYFDKLVHCDGCAPDDLFRCGGCEITAGVRLRPSASLSMLSETRAETWWDDAAFHRGSGTPVFGRFEAGTGAVAIKYSLYHEIGLFGKGGNFPSDWTRASGQSTASTLTRTVATPCRLPLAGTSTCTANVVIPVVDEMCFGPLCAVDVTLKVVLEHDIVLGPSGIVAQRLSNYALPRSIEASGSPANFTDRIDIPCDAPDGSPVQYELNGFKTLPTSVDVDGNVKLDYFIDGPGTANLGGVAHLFSMGSVLDDTLTLSGGGSLAGTLGGVTPDADPPSLGKIDLTAAIPEGGTVRMRVPLSDNCTAWTTIDWGDGTIEQLDSPGKQLGIDTTHVYTDDRTYEVGICAGDGVNTTCAGATTTVANVPPATQLAAPAMTRVGETVSFRAATTDPGHDDLTHTWGFGDGTPPVVSVSPVSLPVAGTDAAPGPRDIEDEQRHAYAEPCTYSVRVTAEDDDGGIVSVIGSVAVTGNADAAYGAGYWQHRFKQSARELPARLGCYLGMVGPWSRVFDEVLDASTVARARAVLQMAKPASPSKQFDRQLLVAWLNVANGGLVLDEPLDADGDGEAETTAGELLTSAEAARVATGATAVTLEPWKDRLERLNAGRI